ncbi:hypothetical protein D0Z07_8117 [Hyphodiscus hymeniophilus]|uniref:Uncharacterized protein n=1 Tax=Hyphodiscus hymeniophilus TaxID=353542 RepID=A0A9P6SLT2_9HELO|nr:hypothetical protein D0Z07_8117 [Hyphodiscus hymeniophilus]
MKSIYSFLILAQGAFFVTAGTCNADNCARAVTGTARGVIFQSSALKWCSSFLQATVIATSTETATEFWGLLTNLAFTPVGGCQTEPQPSDEILWAYNAFNANYFLQVSPSTATLSVGQTVVFTVHGYDGGGQVAPVAVAWFDGLPTNSQGQVVFVATQPGTFRYKATRSDSIRSAAVVITVTA